MSIVARLPIGFWLSCVLYGMLAAAATVEPLPYLALVIWWSAVLPYAYQMERDL